jgi:hypothetical protein
MKKLGAFLKGVLKGGVVDSTPISGIIDIVKSFDKKYLIQILDTNGDGKLTGEDLVNLKWEQIGKAVGLITFIVFVLWATAKLGIDVNQLF